MTRDYFCRNTLRDLREKTIGFPIPSQKRSGPEPSSSPAPIQPAPKHDPFYLHPKSKTRARTVVVDAEKMQSAIDQAFQPQPTPACAPEIVRNIRATTSASNPSISSFVEPVIFADGSIKSFKLVEGENNP